MDSLINTRSSRRALCWLTALWYRSRFTIYKMFISRRGNFSNVSNGESSYNYTACWNVRKCFFAQVGRITQFMLFFSGLMMESEKKIFEIMNKKAAMSKYWMPLVWATNIINRARKEALITSDQVVQTLLVELSDIRKRLGALIGYDTVCVPLVYTQVNISLNKIKLRYN